MIRLHPFEQGLTAVQMLGMSLQFSSVLLTHTAARARMHTLGRQICDSIGWRAQYCSADVAQRQLQQHALMHPPHLFLQQSPRSASSARVR